MVVHCAAATRRGLEVKQSSLCRQPCLIRVGYIVLNVAGDAHGSSIRNDRPWVWLVIAATGLALTATPASGQQSPATSPGSNEPPILISDSNTGYVDNAIVGNQLRLRADASYNQKQPDRAEFFYAKCGCYGPPAPGMPQPEKSVDAGDLMLGIEYAPVSNFSLFAEVPYRAVNPEVNANASGLGDIQLGLKYAVLASRQHYVTLQLRAYAPSGDARKGLGTHHWSIEPGLLYYGQLSERLALSGELRYFLPINGSSGQGTGFNEGYAGDVLRYGIGLSYDLDSSSSVKISPIVELVGWRVFDGLMLDENGIPQSARANIVNLKLGARFRFTNQDSVYVGVGHALTNEAWYENIARLEYRRTF